MIVEQRYSIFGYRFSFRTNYPRAAELLSHLYSGREDSSPAAHGDAAANVYELWHRPSGESPEWTIQVPGSPLRAMPSFGDAIADVEGSITGDLTRYRHGLHVVHGAVVYGPDGDLLLTGDSSAGKTTLSLALRTRGLRVGGDDLALLDPVTGVFLPHPRCFHLDERSVQLLAELGLHLPADLVRDQFVTPADLGVTTATPAQVRFIFLMEPERLPAPRIVPETQAQAAAALLMQTGRGQFTDIAGVRSMARLTGPARCFRVWSGGLNSTVDAVLDIVGPVLA